MSRLLDVLWEWLERAARSLGSLGPYDPMGLDLYWGDPADGPVWADPIHENGDDGNGRAA